MLMTSSMLFWASKNLRTGSAPFTYLTKRKQEHDKQLWDFTNLTICIQNGYQRTTSKEFSWFIIQHNPRISNHGSISSYEAVLSCIGSKFQTAKKMQRSYIWGWKLSNFRGRIFIFYESDICDLCDVIHFDLNCSKHLLWNNNLKVSSNTRNHEESSHMRTPPTQQQTIFFSLEDWTILWYQTCSPWPWDWWTD